MPRGDDDEDRPIAGEVEAGEQGGDALRTCRRPPSTIRPPCANPCRPIPERRPRPESSARSVGRGVGRARPGVDEDPRDGQAQLGADAEADVLLGRLMDPEIARRDRRCPRRSSRPAMRSATWRTRRRAGLRPPVGRRLGGQLEPGRVDHQADAAELAGRLRAPAQEAEVEPARCPDAESRHGRGCVRVEPATRRANARDVVVEQRRRPRARRARPSSRPGRPACGYSARISSSGEERGPGGQDRRLDDRVLGAVQAEEVAEPALGDGLGDDRRPVVAVVERRPRGTRNSGRRRARIRPRTTSAGRVGDVDRQRRSPSGPGAGRRR